MTTYTPYTTIKDTQRNASNIYHRGSTGQPTLPLGHASYASRVQHGVLCGSRTFTYAFPLWVFCLNGLSYTHTCTRSGWCARDCLSHPTSPSSRPHSAASPHIVTLNPHPSGLCVGALRMCLDAKAPCRGHKNNRKSAWVQKGSKKKDGRFFFFSHAADGEISEVGHKRELVGKINSMGEKK